MVDSRLCCYLPPSNGSATNHTSCTLPPAADLFFPCGSQEQRLAQLSSARGGALPAVLGGAHTAGAAQALQDLVRSLLQADPVARPTVHGLLRAGLADTFRQLAQLPHWRLAASQQAVQQAAAAEQQPAAQQEQPAPAAAAAPAAQPALGGAVVAVDHDAVRHFLLLLRKSKQQEVAAAQAQLAALEVDIGETVKRRGGSDVASSCPAGAAATAEQPAAKRQRCGEAPAELGAVVAAEAKQRLAAALPRLEEVYFQRRGAAQAAVQQHAQAAGPADAPAASGGSEADGEAPHLEPFAADLQRLAARSRLGLKAALRCGDIASPTEMVRGAGRLGCAGWSWVACCSVGVGYSPVRPPTKLFTHHHWPHPAPRRLAALPLTATTSSLPPWACRAASRSLTSAPAWRGSAAARCTTPRCRWEPSQGGRLGKVLVGLVCGLLGVHNLLAGPLKVQAQSCRCCPVAAA